MELKTPDYLIENCITINTSGFYYVIKPNDKVYKSEIILCNVCRNEVKKIMKLMYKYKRKENDQIFRFPDEDEDDIGEIFASYETCYVPNNPIIYEEDPDIEQIFGVLE